MKLSIIIPVFNERDLVLEAISQVEAVHLIDGIEKEIVVVDDGSTDGTAEILRALGKHKILFHAKNQGKGRAIRTALEAATGDFVITHDADLEYDPADINLLLAEVVNKGAVAVFGSRRLNRANRQYSAFSFYWGGLALTYFANWLYGIELTDEPTCYKLVRTDILRDMQLSCERFEFCPEVVAKLARMGHPIFEVPIHYFPRNMAQGKKIRWRDGVEALRVLWQFRKFGKDRPHFNRLDKFIRFLRTRRIVSHIPRAAKILDFGAGRDGSLLHYLYRKRYITHGVGVDLHVEDSVQHGIELRRGGMERIRPGEQFDAVTMLAVLEHLDDPKEVLRKIHGVLKPEGLLILTVPSIRSQPILEFLAYRLKIISEAEIRDHKTYYDRTSLMHLLHEMNFREVRHKYFQLTLNNFIVAKK